MRTHPLLHVGEVTPDPELLQKIPHAMALYYMALPIAGEDGQVSVAMAYPENTTALDVLSYVLGRPVVVVRGLADAIRAALWPLQDAPMASPFVIACCTQPRPDACQAPVVAWTKRLGAALDAQTRLLETPPASFADDFAAVAREHPRLIVLDTAAEPLRSIVLCRATAPIFLVRGSQGADSTAETLSLRRILVVLRGYASDEQALAWATMLSAETHASIVLLPLTGERVSALHEFLGAEGGTNHQPTLRRTSLAEGQVCVKVRQGAPVSQIVAEAAADRYDLIIIAAEGEGAFVGQVIAELERREVHTDRPLLILKPTL